MTLLTRILIALRLRKPKPSPIEECTAHYKAMHAAIDKTEFIDCGCMYQSDAILRASAINQGQVVPRRINARAKK